MSKKKRILIIDDTDTVRVYLSTRMSPKYDVLVAKTGEEGLAVLRENEVGLVVTDYIMPGIDGLEVLDRLKEQHPSLPTILMTAFGSIEVKQKAESRGARYFNKPMDLELFDAMVEEELDDS